MKKSTTKEKVSIFLTLLKYMFSIGLTFAAGIQVGENSYILAGIVELLFIYVISNIILSKKIVGQIVNDILMLFYNAQMAVLLFANSYITMVMLTNIASIKALSGKAVIYITGVLLVLVFSFTPSVKVKWDRKSGILMTVFSLGMWLSFQMLFGVLFSPIYGYVDLVLQYRQSVQLEKTIKEAVNGNADAQVLLQSEFYNEEIKDYKEKDEALVEQPNVILIFTEGLSQSVIDDDRGIMNNVAEWQEKSFSFTNYYNHTFATYRGLISQMYSGYQLEDFDSNPLISIQSILSDEGYGTYFINSEPNNTDFTAYLNNLGYDQVLGDTESECNGMADSISDKDVYEMLFQVAEEKNELKEPFFLSTYTFGTHASLDSTDQKYGDGKVAELNKFYDVDYQFGQFMEKFLNSPLVDNTILIFTADHATYQDDSFSAAFPEYKRATTSMDEVPLFIYYDGIEPGTLDVGGRNTICLAPTILDFLDITAPNYFVGTSLYSGEAASICETSYSDSHVIYTSKNGEIGQLDAVIKEEFQLIIQNYYILKEMGQ